MTDFHQNFNLFFDGLEMPRQHRSRSEQMQLHSQMGEGEIRRFVPREDIEVVISDFTFHRNRKLLFGTQTAMVELNYCLQGKREIHVGGAQYEFVPGICSLQFMNEVDVEFQFNGNHPYLMLGIGIPVTTFHHYMEEVGGTRSFDFFEIMGQRSFHMFQETIDPAASVILQRVLQSAQSYGTKNVEMECRILELISMAFQSFLIDGDPSNAKLPKRDWHKIREARDIILERMTDPPTLIELSRMIGLNDCKLKKGFKELYGTTVFGYLRDKRLEKAYHLLQQGMLNVTETSCEVGYSNCSYFSEVFREKYGVNPGEFIRHSATRRDSDNSIELH
ncbi:helix-turn-helix transcriptional regulator [Paenibacillus alba]|uniref:helix-turn-helix transcriptional regulator n=1 Tax=Paenibacillus alba TaxID=1197127 RepID=UPI0015631EB9|nr:AraC family transcriptional regulator [Paenibacillus alba]NQX68315.1 helix-turn-helix transcriptional regulator [Paenibacillus alba]